MDHLAPPISPIRLKSLSSWSSLEEEIAGNRDILVEILLRLPARSIIRFMSVCKQWGFLISEKWFSAEHVRRNPKPSISGLFYDRYTHYPIPLVGHSLPTLTFMDPKPPVCWMAGLHILDSCHGLILCSGWPTNYPACQFIVCNPTTQRYKLLHQEGFDKRGGNSMEHSYLYFYPSLSPIYKVITIIKEDMRSYYEVCIYTSNCSTWKTIRLEAQQSWGHLGKRGFSSSDGVIHMFTKNHYHVQFNVATEQISGALVTFEPERPLFCFVRYVGKQVDGNLVLILTENVGFDIMIYEMDQQEGRHWVLKHRVYFKQQFHKLCHPHRQTTWSDLSFLHVFWGGEKKDMDLTIVSVFEGKCVSYNHKSEETKVISDVPFTNRDTAYLKVHPFIGSLTAI